MSGTDKIKKDFTPILGILDDTFPDTSTAFRVCEFRKYFSQNKYTKAYSTVNEFENKLADYLKIYPVDSGKIQVFSEGVAIECDLFYVVFLNNIFNYLPTIAKADKPFIFTLYPGGGFALNNEESDRKLQIVFSSENFGRVIVTQKVIYDYLISKRLCSSDKIKLIYGGTFPSDVYLDTHREDFYSINKKYMDICFVAYKYMPGGIDKGYDTFIKVAEKLAVVHPDVRFHIVGNFDLKDGNIEKIKDKITFYGKIQTSDFSKFYSNKDIILSPTRNSVLHRGSFDGFPTGSCMEAAFNGVAVFTTDPLKQNTMFVDGKEIVIINNDPDSIVNKIEPYFQKPERLRDLAITGRNAFFKNLDIGKQMDARYSVINFVHNEFLKGKKGKDNNTLELSILKSKLLFCEYESFNDEMKQREKIKVLHQNIENQSAIIEQITSNAYSMEKEINRIHSSLAWRIYTRFKKVLRIFTNNF